MTALKSVLVALAIGFIAEWGGCTATTTAVEPFEDGVGASHASHVATLSDILISPRHLLRRGNGKGNGKGKGLDCEKRYRYPECCRNRECRKGEKCEEGMCVSDCRKDYPKCCGDRDCDAEEREKCVKGMCEKKRSCAEACFKCEEDNSRHDDCIRNFCRDEGVTATDKLVSKCCTDAQCPDGKVCDATAPMYKCKKDPSP